MLRNFIVVLAVLILSLNQNIFSHNINDKSNDQGLKKFPGFIGVYHNFNGTVYGGWGIKQGELLQRAFNFGENGLICQAAYSGYTFKACLDSSMNSWYINKIFGVIRPPSEDGVINQPGDTLLLEPFASYPGMIQAAHRYSELSKKYPQISGIIIDDFFSNNGYPHNITLDDIKSIKDALLGKKVDKYGNVDHNSGATTPNLKLYVVLYPDYEHQITIHDKTLDKIINGISMWIWKQTDDYKKLDDWLGIVRKYYPREDINVGVYVNPVNVGKAITHQSVTYLLKSAIDLYNDGKVSGIQIFSGPWLAQQYISKARWDSLAIPETLNKYYYPYLGEGVGKIIDAGTGKPLSNALVTIQRANSMIPIIITRKLTRNSGEYDFGAWAGTDKEIKYKITVEKASYKPQTIEVSLKQQEKISLPEIKLQKSRT